MTDGHEPDDAREAGANDAAEALDRRNFMEILGASFAAISLAGCDVRGPRETVVPHLVQPEDAVDGLARWYATTCGGCPAACGLLVKNRDGRPIKAEGNPDHPLSLGGVCARGQATLLDLYDSGRPRGPRRAGAAVAWSEADAEILRGLEDAARDGKEVRILGGSTPGPTLRRVLDGFQKAHPRTKVVRWDPLSCSAILDAHAISHRRRVLPAYRFDKAKVVVAFDADFLGTWLAPVEFTRGWALNRRLGAEPRAMSWHAQFESRFSLTGANADLRVPVRPSKLPYALTALLKTVAARLHRPEADRLPMGEPRPVVDPAVITRTAEALIEARGRALVVSGVNDVGVQLMVNLLNHLLDGYGTTLDLSRPSRQYEGDDAAMDALIGDMTGGRVGVLFLLDANPVYHHPRGAAFAEALARVPLTVSLSPWADESAAKARFHCPDHHFLESWGDAHPHEGVYTLRQPLLAPLYDTRAAVESLARWSGGAVPAHEQLRATWRADVHPLAGNGASFEAFWEDSLRRGVALTEGERLPDAAFDPAALDRIAIHAPDLPEDATEFVTHPTVALGDGAQANNPWLQELPDPVTKVCWGHVASVSPATAARLGIVEGRMLEISAPAGRVRLPAHVQPGMPDRVVAAALGYGRPGAGKIAANYPIEKMFPVEREIPAGENLFPFVGTPAVEVRVLDAMSPLAKTQVQESQKDPFTGRSREVVRETTLAAYLATPHTAGGGEAAGAGPESLWPGHASPGIKWGMAVDANACTGCSACVVSCQAENNVPVVGKAEVRKRRDMHWIRLDRYYGDGADGGSPDVVFQPMLCQHCDNAPCETVCPVLATVHSAEGLNQQVYNRCVGTRYCANNCPYKVRRFNWFDYAHADPAQNLALNPDVTVRSRGVMEKCSFCVQRLNEAKAGAKAEGRRLRDGEARPACVQSCPAEALVFGDLNDPRSRVSALARDGRAYGVLSELGVRPSVVYLTKVRNRKA